MNDKKRTELVEKRSAHRKVFENPDHSFTAELYLDAVHYQDEDGSWQEMDDCLAEKEKSFFNKKGKFQFHTKEHARERGMFTLKNGDAVLCWGLEGAKAVNAVRMDDRKLRYQEILPGVEMRCRTNGEKVKEDLILTSAMAAGKFTYIYELNGLTPVQHRNSVVFKDTEGKECFRVSAPYMKDAAGNTSEAITVMLDTQEKQAEMPLSEKGCRITFSADKEWLTAPERVYPVTIDPVTTTSKDINDIIDMHVDSLNEEVTNPDSQPHILKTMGGDNIQRSFVKFVLPEMKTGDMVVNAKLVMAAFPNNTDKRSITVHKVLQDWDSPTLNWNNKPIYEEIVQDVCRFSVGNATSECRKGEFITFDITRLVKDWYQNGENYGLMFKDEYEILRNYTEYQSSDSDAALKGQRPRIEISYMNYSGIEDYWSYHTQNVGRAGSIYVNDYNGNLILVHDTLSMSGSRMPVSLAHVYNSNDKNEDIGYGYGFRLNYHQTLESVTIADTKYYKHVDDNGTAHYFYKDSEGVWKDEAITDRILNENTDGTFTIKDKEDNQLVFGGGGYLEKLVDNSGQTLSIEYNNKHISKLTDAAGRSVNLTYAACSDGKKRLSAVEAPDGSRKTFTYSDAGRLIMITDADGSQMKYTYNQYQDIERVDNADKYNVRYTYYTAAEPYRVKTITEYADDTAGRSLTLAYGHNSTKFKDDKGNTEIYRFNNLGNLIHIHDGFGHAASAKYDREGDQVNCLKNATKLQDNIIQLFKNPAMLNGTTGWGSALSPNTAAGENTLNTDTSYCMVGPASLRSYCSDITGHAYWSQKVKIKKGVTYTASMYVRAEITEVSDGGAMLRVRYKAKDDTYKYFDSEYLKASTMGFVRLYVTFTVPEDAASDTIKFYMAMRHATGTMYGDLAQLEVGDTPNRCNLIDNGSLHLGTADDHIRTGDAEDVLTTVGTSERVAFHHHLIVVKSSTVLYGDATADEANVVAALTKNTHISGFAAVVEKLSTGTTKTWYHVVTESGKYGYVVSSDVAAYVSSGDSLTAGVAAATVNLRSSASSGSTSLGSVPKDCPLVVISSKNDSVGKLWYRVGLNVDNNRYVGYLPTEVVTQLYKEKYERTITSAASLYESPSASASVIKTVAAKTKLVIGGILTDASGTVWYAVKTGAVYGYLKDSLLTEQKMSIIRISARISWTGSS